MPQKNSKRGRKVVEKVHDLPDLDPFQQYAKVYSAQGERRFLTVTNDGTVVSAHVCGKMRKRVWVQKNDIVIISLRDEMAMGNDKTHGLITKGDICAKVPQELYGKLKKIDGFNLLKTFNEKSDGSIVLGSGAEGGGFGADDDAGYEFVYDGEEEDEDDGNESDSSSASHDSQKKDRRKKTGQARKELTAADIDAI